MNFFIEDLSGSLNPLNLIVKDSSENEIFNIKEINPLKSFLRYTVFRTMFNFEVEVTGRYGIYHIKRSPGFIKYVYTIETIDEQILWRIESRVLKWKIFDSYNNIFAELESFVSWLGSPVKRKLKLYDGKEISDIELLPVFFTSKCNARLIVYHEDKNLFLLSIIMAVICIISYQKR